MPRDKYNPGLRGVSSLATSVSWSRVGRRTLSTPQSLAQERMVKPCWQGQLAPLGIYWKMDQDLTSCQPHRCEAVVLGQGDQADEMVKSHTLSPWPQEWCPCLGGQRWQPWWPPQVGVFNIWPHASFRSPQHLWWSLTMDKTVHIVLFPNSIFCQKQTKKLDSSPFPNEGDIMIFSAENRQSGHSDHCFGRILHT